MAYNKGWLVCCENQSTPGDLETSTMSHYKDQYHNFNKENICGSASQVFPFEEGKKVEKINWDKEVDFVFEEMKKDQERGSSGDERGDKEDNVYAYP